MRPQRLLREGLLASARRQPAKTAVVVEGVDYSYQQLADAANRLADALVARGLRRGDRVAVFMSNTWPCIVSIYAVLLAGGVFVVINPQTRADKLAYIIGDSEARLLLTDYNFFSVYSSVVRDNATLAGIIACGECAESHIAGLPHETFNQVIATSTPLRSPVPVIPNDLAALIYTSGSTGEPKGVMQTHQSMVFAAWSLIEYQRFSEHDRILLVLPFAFDYGLYQLFMAMKVGATLIVERSFAFPAQVYKRIEQQRVSVFPGVPTIFAMMVASHKKSALSFPSVTRITNTAAALAEEFVPYLREIFPHALIYKMYGLTECKRVSYLEPELVDSKPGSVGKAIPGTEVYLLSPEGEPVLPPGEGILHVRGPHIMAGYWKKPELTGKMLKPGRFPGERVLCSQDWFRMDDQGFLYFIGRSDDVIKVGGEKVSPVEVENALYKVAGVREAAVVGVTDYVYGQLIRAFVVLDVDCDLDAKAIRQQCSVYLENFMMPRDVIIMDSLPKSPNGKIDKKELLKKSAA